MPDITSLMLGTAVPIIALTIVAIVVVMFVVRRFTGPDKQLLATGETAQATVVQIWDTGVTINDNPRIGLLLDVQPANRPAYQVKTAQTVSRLQTSMYQPGQTLEVKIDPANPKKIAITAVISGGMPGMAGMAPAAQVAQVQQTLLATEQMYQAVRSMGVPAQAVCPRRDGYGCARRRRGFDDEGQRPGAAPRSTGVSGRDARRHLGRLTTEVSARQHRLGQIQPQRSDASRA